VTATEVAMGDRWKWCCRFCHVARAPLACPGKGPSLGEKGTEQSAPVPRGTCSSLFWFKYLSKYLHDSLQCNEEFLTSMAGFSLPAAGRGEERSYSADDHV